MTKAIHSSITLARVIELCERADSSPDNPGICLACGADHDACEPDAQNYEYEECGENQVQGAEVLLMVF